MKLLFATLLLFAPMVFVQPAINELDSTSDNSSTNTLSKFDALLQKKELSELNLPAIGVLELGLIGYNNLLENKAVKKTNILTIIDFSLPSNQERMWVIDMHQGVVLYNCLVAHGRNSGDLFAEKFSNKPGSFTSSPGFYLTDQIYTGRHGTSLYLDGLEEGINDKARYRTIVIHSADYVSYDFIKTHGRLGRSHGCPAIPVELHKDLINTIKGGSCLYIHAPDDQYVTQSKILNLTTGSSG
jgi:hypothetical protein